MALTNLRRIVTANNSEGRSYALIDGGPANELGVDGAGLAEIWTAALGSDLMAATDKLAGTPMKLEPDAGHVKVRWFTVAPEDASKSDVEREAAAAFGFAAVQASAARVDTSRHPMMHKTHTLDVIILVKGEVELLLDEGDPMPLNPGDVVMQRATNHAWVNRGSEIALLVAVLIDESE